MYFDVVFLAALKFMDRTVASLLIVTFVNSKRLSLFLFKVCCLVFHAVCYPYSPSTAAGPLFLFHLCFVSSSPWGT